MPEKVAYHHGDLRQALIAGAIALIAEQDVSSLSLREVARRVGVSHAAPYRHFQDKDSLLAAVAEEGFLELTAAMNRGWQQASEDYLQQLEAVGVAYVLFAIARPSHYRVMFGSFRCDPCASANLAQVGQQAFQVLLDRIAAAQRAGIVRSADTRQLAWAAWSMVHGLSMLLIDGRLAAGQPQDAQQLAKLVVRTLSEGLVRSPSA